MARTDGKRAGAAAKRRDVLRLAGLGTAAAGTLAVAGKAAPAAASTSGRPVAGYRETDLVKKAYALARF